MASFDSDACSDAQRLSGVDSVGYMSTVCLVGPNAVQLLHTLHGSFHFLDESFRSAESLYIQAPPQRIRRFTTMRCKLITRRFTYLLEE